MRHLMTQRIMHRDRHRHDADRDRERDTGGRGDRRATVAQIPRSPSIRPNVVLVVTDDQRADSMTGHARGPPADRRSRRPLLQRRGQQSFCCPSRATILTGLYCTARASTGNGGTRGWGRSPAPAPSGSRSPPRSIARATARVCSGSIERLRPRRPATYPGLLVHCLGENGAYFNYRTFDNAVGTGSTARRRRTTRPT